MNKPQPPPSRNLKASAEDEEVGTGLVIRGGGWGQAGTEESSWGQLRSCRCWAEGTARSLQEGSQPMGEGHRRPGEVGE